MAGHPVKGFCPKEPAPPGPGSPTWHDVVMQVAVRRLRREAEVAAASLCVEVSQQREGFDDGRFARPVVSDEHGDGLELDRLEVTNGGQLERETGCRQV